MIEDVYDPLLRYRDEFCAKFSHLSFEKFREMVDTSGVDVKANRKTIAEIKDLTASADVAKIKLLFLKVALVLSLFAIIVGGVLSYYKPEIKLQSVITGVVGVFVFFITSLIRARVLKKLRGINDEIEKKRKLAWEQMAPLNKLYTWDIIPKLIEATVPRLQFDPYFTKKRLDDLHRIFGWDKSFNENKSILNAQTGVINGNPFVIGEYVAQTWGEHTYTGSIVIYWSETIEVDGKTQVVEHAQTLYAQVTKPIPVYNNEKILIYGNEASPNLKFSRTPSELSDDGNGLFERLHKKWVIHKLKAYSRNLEDESDFTLMSNHDFEALFYAKNRDNEVEFRLLFTTLAQKQMLDLLRDSKVGFGDDFTFIKDKKINMIYAEHMKEAIIDTNPARFHDFDFDKAMLNFKNFAEKYFKDVYFALAPILAIPIYQQTRTFEDIYKDVINSPASFWELESCANFHGEDKFRHYASITQNILKIGKTTHRKNLSTVEVVAHGFRGVERTTYIDVWGGDGYYHTVPVNWIEYIPVEKSTTMCVSADENVAEYHKKSSSANGNWRRSLYSYIFE